VLEYNEKPANTADRTDTPASSTSVLKLLRVKCQGNSQEKQQTGRQTDRRIDRQTKREKHSLALIISSNSQSQDNGHG